MESTSSFIRLAKKGDILIEPFFVWKPSRFVIVFVLWVGINNVFKKSGFIFQEPLCVEKPDIFGMGLR